MAAVEAAAVVLGVDVISFFFLALLAGKETIGDSVILLGDALPTR
jgi:hypothetical protein